MIQRLKKYPLLFFFIYLTVWTSLASTPLNEQFRFSTVENRIFSVLLYLPFLLLILWKFAGDIKDLKKNPVNLFYYLFGVYYVALSAYRLVTGQQIKESIYYSVVLFGSVALFCQLRDKRLAFDRETYSANFKGIALYMVAYKFIFTALSTNLFGIPRWLGNPPINNLYSTSMLVMLLPFMIDSLRAKRRGSDVLLCLSLVLIAICNSRAIFMLALGIFAVMLIVNLKSRKLLLRAAAAFLCAVLIVGVLAVGNVGGVRYSLYRATGLFGSATSQPQPTDPSSTDPTEDSSQSASQAQIDRSDSMRLDLMKLAVEQVRLNPWFGTGELFYTYDMGYKVMEQTSHNFILESLVCYGVIGTAMIAALLLSMLVSCGFFRWKKTPLWQLHASAFLTLGYYFAFGMVQPSVYNTLLCPLFTALVGYYGSIFPARKPDGPSGKTLK